MKQTKELDFESNFCNFRDLIESSNKDLRENLWQQMLFKCDWNAVFLLQADRGNIQDLCQGGAWLPVHFGDGGAGEEWVRRDGRHCHRGGVWHSCLDNNEQQRISKQYSCQALFLRVHDVRKQFLKFKASAQTRIFAAFGREIVVFFLARLNAEISSWTSLRDFGSHWHVRLDWELKLVQISILEWESMIWFALSG